ncbi:hypothetical protein BH09ACT4_BH09ACT4_16540 [soil metagenome]
MPPLGVFRSEVAVVTMGATTESDIRMPTRLHLAASGSCAVAVGTLLMLTGCASIGDLAVVPTDEPMSWDCYYEPTINDNWHDDVICQRGTESIRPILLKGQFVTEADMVAAGEAYEAELNG